MLSVVTMNMIVSSEKRGCHIELAFRSCRGQADDAEADDELTESEILENPKYRTAKNRCARVLGVRGINQSRHLSDVSIFGILPPPVPCNLV